VVADAEEATSVALDDVHDVHAIAGGGVDY
jgi:hypothetical protein